MFTPLPRAAPAPAPEDAQPAETHNRKAVATNCDEWEVRKVVDMILQAESRESRASIFEGRLPVICDSRGWGGDAGGMRLL
jgi:hypothetical protein